MVGSLALYAAAADATTISWATLTSGDGSNVAGSITAGSETVTFTADSDNPYLFVNLNDTGSNYWTGSSYTYNGTYNQPQDSDIIALSDANTETITFSEPVSNLYLALNSYNGASVTFSMPFGVVSEGCGIFGCGSFISTGPDSFYGNNEAAGILEIPGTFTSLTMTDSVDEEWHGFTLGIGAIGPIPEPATWALMLLGFGGLGCALRAHLRSSRRVISLEP